MSDGAILSLIFGLLGVAAAGGCAWMATKARRRGAAIEATETTPCGQVAARVTAGAPPGDDVELTECVGVARPGPGGVLTAPTSEQAAVWYRTTLTHHYWDTELRRDSDGRQRREQVRRRQIMSDHGSEVPFTLTDSTGEVSVDPREARVDKPAKVYDQFEKRPREGFMKEFFLGDRTIGYQTEEWVIAPDQELYVLGGVGSGPGGATFTKPDRGELLISTRSEEELLGSTRRAAMWWTVAAVAAGAIGLLLLALAVSL